MSLTTLSALTSPVLDIHFRVKVNGSREKLNFFHYVMGRLDPDYPLAPPQLRRSDAPTPICPKCRGFIWYSPTLEREDIEKLARQINASNMAGHIKLKIRGWRTPRECEGLAQTEGDRQTPTSNTPAVDLLEQGGDVPFEPDASLVDEEACAVA